MKSTLLPRALWAVAALLAVVAVVRVTGASSAAVAPSRLTCGPGAVVVDVGTDGPGVPLPMAVATAAPTLPVAAVARLNRVEATSTLAPNLLGQNCLIVSAGARAAASTPAAPGK